MKHKGLTIRLMLALVLVLLLAPMGTVGAQEPRDNGWVGDEDGPTLQELPIVVDAGWSATDQTPPAFFWLFGDPFNQEGAFTFTSATPVMVKVTDDFCKGDQFRIYDFGVVVGDTSAVAQGSCIEVGPDAAYADPTYSSGAFLLGPGPHSITIQVIVNPFNNGRGYIRVDTVTGAFVTDISDPDAYSCYQPGYIDFEAYADGFNLSASAIGGVQFTTTGGYTWSVGDFATGLYNGKYPNGGYTSQGTHWAWLGIDQGTGRIDFVNGPASYFSLLTSLNFSDVYLEAYDASNNLLDTAGPATINYNTGRMWELAFSRYSADMAYVIVHDAGNFFDVDAICTDAPGVGNSPPTADPNGPYLGAVDTSISFDGTGSSDPDGDPLAYEWEFGDGSPPVVSDATPSHIYEEASIYDVCLLVDDGYGGSDQACTIAVVYDPNAGFVTGGGWIDSPEGAYTAEPLLVGKANFGFVSKYKKGATTPDGNTEFQFKAADLNFHSSSYEWLVVTGSDYAKFKGVGTINGMGDYKFILWAGDGDPDTFRIKIWEEVDGIEAVVYDNGSDQTIGGGSIVIHRPSIAPVEVLDQSQTIINYGYWFDNEMPRWQEFLPTLDNLSAVEIYLKKDGNPGNVILEVRTAQGKVLGQETVSGESINNYEWVRFDFLNSITLKPGSKYRLYVFSDLDSTSPDNRYVWMGDSDSSYCPECETDVKSTRPKYAYAFKTFAISQ